MSLKVWMVAVGMMLMWGAQGYAAGSDYTDSLEKSTTLNFSVHVKEPTCQIVVPESVEFGQPTVLQMSGRGVDRDFSITLKNCTQSIPKPRLVFSGEQIDNSGMYIKNKHGSDYAGGVGVRLLFRGREFKISDGITLDSVGTTGPKSFHFRAHLGKEGSDKVTAGKVDTSVTVSMTYN
ncbi:type 1 fimbrial protein [Escherichia coli]|nr:type 1 fimbrial protein [Escherichia coli]